MNIRRLSENGRQEYRDWLATRKQGDLPPKELRDGDDQTETVQGVKVDADRRFASRYEFGEYIVGAFSELDPKALLSH